MAVLSTARPGIALPASDEVNQEQHMNVLVTGGAGYIGSHTAKALAGAGYHPVVADDLRTGHREVVKWGPLVEVDIAENEGLRRLFRDYRIDAVIHFAASAYVGESMQEPSLYFHNNVLSTLTLLDVMREHGVDKIVFSSSCATYGNPTHIPIEENHLQRPVSPYGESKLMCEKLLHWYGGVYGVRWLALRYFNAAGSDLGGELGEEHEPETHLVPLAIQAAVGIIPYLEIYGTDYETPDGTAIRDYIHVVDLAGAHLAALRYLDEGGPSAAVNLGTGTGYSVADVVSATERVTGRTVRTRKRPRRPGDPPCLVADAAKANSLLAWVPNHSAIDVIVGSTWRWQMSQKLSFSQKA
jgi:UDP-arabinose 4-epimerase